MSVLVTGGSGFLGGAIVRLLLERGTGVRALVRSDCPSLKALGVDTVMGDLTDSDAVIRAAHGCDTVFHAAAKVGAWGAYSSYHEVNVTGTTHVIEACRRQGVPRLVYTSTPSVVFDGRDEEGIDESTPYSRHFLCHYSRSKAEAERMVLAANGPALATVALRPHLIWGPGDRSLLPRIVQRAEAGTLRLVGACRNQVDSTYIDNAAWAHLQAAGRLAPGSACAGKAYFISNGEPMPLAELLNGLLEAAGAPPAGRRISASAAYALGALCELRHALTGREDEPPLTRFVARQLATSHWFDLSAARRDLGYEPRITIREGLERLRAAYAHSHAV